MAGLAHSFNHPMANRSPLNLIIQIGPMPIHVAITFPDDILSTPLLLTIVARLLDCRLSTVMQPHVSGCLLNTIADKTGMGSHPVSWRISKTFPLSCVIVDTTRRPTPGRHHISPLTGGPPVKSVPCFILFISLLACSDPSGNGMSDNPVGPVILAKDAGNTVSESISAQNVEYEPFVHDSLRVSFEGTTFKILNTSGGTRLVTGKHFIFDIDWNVQAWNPDSTEVDLVAISESPEWHPVKGTFGFGNLNLTIYCTDWDDLWWNGPGVGYNSGISDDFLVSRLERNGIKEDGSTYSGTLRGDGRTLVQCQRLGNLRMRIQYPVYGSGWRNTDRDTWMLNDNDFPFPDSVEFYPPIGLHVTYHPIVPDSSYIESETAWLNYLLEDRRTFKGQLERMLPIWVNGIVVIGGPLVVPPDTTVSDHFEDEVFVRALEKLRSEYPNKVGFSSLFVGRDDIYLRIRTGIMSERMQETYGEARIASRGRGYVGQPWSVFLYEKKWPLMYGDEILAHEIGHNLNLIHTEEDPDYPGYPSELNRDAFLVESDYPHGIQIIDGFHARPLMHNGFGNDGRKWLSEYNWNNILDFVNSQTSPVSARVVAGWERPMWICNGDH